MQKTDRHESLTILIPVLDQDNELQLCMTPVGGLTLIRRVTLMAAKAGFDKLLVVSDAEKNVIEATLAGTGARLEACAAWHTQARSAPILLLAPDCLPDSVFFEHLFEQQVRLNEMLFWDDRQAVLLGADVYPDLQGLVAQAGCFKQLVKALLKKEPSPSKKSGYVGISIRNNEDIRRAENALLPGLVKATEGWMALHINRKISLAVTRRLMHTSVTPNHMTWVSMILGLIGAVCFTLPEHGMQILGALFFLAHSILDGCDGELARLKFMESRLGGALDFWSDNIVHVSVFAGMGVGWAAVAPDSFWPWLCAGLAVGGTAVSASLVYFHTMHTEKKAGPLYTSVSTSEEKSAVVRIADILSRRDFIYLVLLLALLNQTHWFLVMTAIGAPVYALLLSGIMIREKQQA